MKAQLVRNYLVVGLRQVIRNKFYSAVTIAGLSLGVGFAFLVFLFTYSEYSYDRFHDRATRIYRVNQEKLAAGTSGHARLSVTPIPIGPYLLDTYSFFEATTRYASSRVPVRIEDTDINQTVHFVDAGFFDMFSFPVLDGDEKPFSSPNGIAITEVAAARFFQGNPLGKTIDVRLNDEFMRFTITAVVDARTPSSSLDFEVLLPFQEYRKLAGAEAFESFKMASVENYVLLKAGVEAGTVQHLFDDEASREKLAEGDDAFRLDLQPLTGIHLDTSVPHGIASVSNPVYAYILSGLAVLILVVGSINFVTLTTSNAFDRAKEIGIRKTMGAIPIQVRLQLTMEALILSFFGACLGVLLAAAAMPVFNDWFASSIRFSASVESVAFLGTLVVLLSMVSGFLPSGLLARLTAVSALREKLQVSPQNTLRKSLVVIQFGLAIVLVFGTLIMHQQMRYISNKDLGFKKEQLITVSLNYPSSDAAARLRADRFLTEVVRKTSPTSVSASMNDFREPWTSLAFNQDDGPPEHIWFNQVDKNYVQTMGLQLVAGRDFSTETNELASSNVLVNEALVKHFGWSKPIGQQLPGSNFERPHTIVGVVRDFHFGSLHHAIEPLVLTLNFQAISSGVTGLSTYKWPPMFSEVLIRYPDDQSTDIRDLGKIWKSTIGEGPFDAAFVQANLDANYANEARWQSMMNSAAVFAIALSLLGLVGLVKLKLHRKVKEIGIRKVLGSTDLDIVVHITSGFIVLLALAVLIAMPVAWWLAAQWLSQFSYHTSVRLSDIVLVSMVVVAFVWLVVGIQAHIASRMNTIKALRTE